MLNELGSVYIVMEYLEHDLKSLIQDMQYPFTEAEIKWIMRELLSAVAYLHDNWTIHRCVDAMLLTC